MLTDAADAEQPGDADQPRAEDASASDDAEQRDSTPEDGSGDDARNGSAETDTNPTDTLPLGPWFEIGTGELGFESVTSDTLLACTFGPQGSYHIWTAIRLHDIRPSALRAELRAEMDGEMVGAGYAAPLDAEWTVHDDGTADVFGQFLYLDFGIDFPARSGQPVTIRGTLSGPEFAAPLDASVTSTFSCLQ